MSDPLAPKWRKRDLLYLPFRRSSRSRSPTPQSQSAVTQPPAARATGVLVQPAVTQSAPATAVQPAVAQPRPASVPVQPAATQSSQATSISAPVQPAVAQSTSATSSNVPVQLLPVTSSPTGQAAGGASSVTDAAFLKEVRKRLTEEQRTILDGSNGQGSGSINSTFESALQAAEDKKELCISKRWTLKFGSRTISPREKAEKVVELLDKFKRIGDIASAADPVHFGLPWAGISLILQVTVNGMHQMDAILSGVATALSMQRTLDVYLGFWNTLPPGPSTTNLTIALVETYVTVLSFLATSIGLLNKGFIHRFWDTLLNDGELQKFGANCLAAEERVDHAAGNCGRSLDAHSRKSIEECKHSLHLVLGDLDVIKNQTARIELSVSLKNLPCASTAAFDSMDEERMPRCLENTRVELLSDINSWVQDPGGVQFFWLQGIAGTGKSTIARTVASILQDHQILGASFFFKRGHAQRGHADLFFATIALQLAQRIPGMNGAVAQALENEIGGYRKGMGAQFRDLVLNPLKATSFSPQASRLDLIVVVDALDECDSGGDRKDDPAQVLEYLSQLKDFQGLRLRLIVTSRLEPPVKVGFAALGSGAHYDVALHELSPNHVERDIQAFIRAELDELRCKLSKLHGHEVLAEGWPGDKVVRDLTKMSVPLFIFASTICRFIGNRNFSPEDRLQKVLDFNPVQLDSTYLLVLQAMISDSGLDTEETSKDDVMENFRKIVGLIIFSTEALSIATLAMLLGLSSHQVMATLVNLHSVLDITEDLDRPVRPFHLSFIEFLARPKKAHQFQIDEHTTHGFLANRCLTVLMRSGTLQQDICQVRKPGSRRLETASHIVESHISPALSYACQYWVHHVEAANVVFDDQYDTLAFLSDWFLYWYEAMSWLGKAFEVPRTLRKLQALTRTDGASKTIEALGDAYQFARHNQYIAGLAPLQLYSSALVFAPDTSITKTNFKSSMPSWLLNPPKIERSWQSDTLKLEGHTSRITAMAFCPDDKLLGTCSLDRTARLWDTTDATCLLTVFLDQYDYYPGAIAFSSDGSKVAVAYERVQEDHPIELVVNTYNTRTGTLLRTTQCSVLFGNNLYLAVAFVGDVDDAIVLIVADVDQVQAWRSVNDSNVFIRAWTSHFPNRQLEGPINVAISQDASLLCCSGVPDENDHGNSSIGVLDPKAGVVTSRHGVNEGFYGVNSSRSSIVYLTGSERREPGAAARSLKRFDVENSGEFTHLLECDGAWKKFSLANARDRVAFNPLFSPTVHVEAITESKMVGRWRQGWYKRKVAVAPRGDLVVDWSDGRLTVLDTKGLVTQTIMTDVDDGESLAIGGRCLTISPDCQYIALGHKKGVTVWNLNTGQRLRYHEIQNQSDLAFSNDNVMMACHDGRTLSVWDLESERMLSSTTDMRGFHLSRRFEFSADGRDLATDRYRFHIATATWTTQEPAKPPLFNKEVSLAGKFLSLEWVRFDDEDLLWIPDECRADLLANTNGMGSDARGGTVALVQEDGSLMILTFDLSVL